MRIGFIGSVSSSQHALSALLESGACVCCVLGLDELHASRVCDYRSLHPLAVHAGVPFLPFRSITEPSVSAFLAKHAPDQLWAIGLSQLVPSDLLHNIAAGAVGFHPTLLPRGRGRAPVAWTILLGERAAATLFTMTDQPDAGDIIAQREVPVLPDDYAEDLIARTNQVLAELIVDLGPRIRDGKLPKKPQNSTRATYYAKRTPLDGLLHWDRGTEHVYRVVRAVGTPYPGAFTFSGGKKITVRRAIPADETVGALVSEKTAAARVGEILDTDEGTLLVGTATGALRVTEYDPADRDAVRVGTVFSASPREDSM